MRVVAALALGAVAVCVAGCASPATQVSPAAPGAATSQPASSQPVSTQAEVSQVASSEPVASQAVSTGEVWSQGATELTSAPAASISVAPALEKRLWALAFSAATSDGGSIKEAQAVGSTHAHAVAVTMSDGVEGDQPVWVVQVEGVADFVCDACFGPPGSSAPHGRFQLLIVDASTFRTLDFGLTNTKADLAQLGPVLDLHP